MCARGGSGYGVGFGLALITDLIHSFDGRDLDAISIRESVRLGLHHAWTCVRYASDSHRWPAAPLLTAVNEEGVGEVAKQLVRHENIRRSCATPLVIRLTTTTT